MMICKHHPPSFPHGSGGNLISERGFPTRAFGNDDLSLVVAHHWIPLLSFFTSFPHGSGGNLISERGFPTRAFGNDDLSLVVAHHWIPLLSFFTSFPHVLSGNPHLDSRQEHSGMTVMVSAPLLDSIRVLYVYSWMPHRSIRV